MVSRARADLGSKKKKIRTGIAISSAELCAADVRLRGTVERVWRVPLDPPPTENHGAPWPSLTSALAELALTLGGNGGTLAISLMPPLTEVRRLELPPLRDEELQRVLSRNASRYFVGARSAQIVGASLVARMKGAQTSVIAAAAPARLIAAIRAAAEQTGWTIEMIAPAEGAWAAAAVALWPTLTRQRAHAIVAHDDRTDVLQLQDGRLVAVRRFRAGAVDAPTIADLVGPAARVGVFGVMEERHALSAALAALGLATMAPAGEWSTAADQTEVLAAHFAGADNGPVLRTESAVLLEKARVRKAAWMVAGAAAALLVASAAIELWGVHRQLALVRAQRELIRPQIASTMIGRTTVDAAYRDLSALNEIERTAPHWSAVIAKLTDVVPGDAFFTAIRTRQDSVIVDGLAERASVVFNAIEKADGLIGVRAAAPVRRELQDGGDPMEHFTIAARVAKPAPSTATPTSPVSAPRPDR